MGSYPHLENLMACWFHQDYGIDGNTLEEVMDAYRRSTTSADWDRVRADIRSFLQHYGDQSLKDAFVRVFNPDIIPEPWGMTTLQFLLKIDQLLK